MSVKLMAMVFENEELGPTERLVLLSLADHADDEGRCYPSIARLMQRTGLKERAVQNNIKKLVEGGYVVIWRGGGRGNANLYVVDASPKPRTKNPVSDDENPAQETPFETTNPASNTENPAFNAENPARDAPEPSRTTKEPSVSKTREADEIRQVLEQWASPDAVASFIAYRRRQKGKALSLRAARRLANNLSEIFNNGGDTDDALGMAEERGWQTVQPHWYFNAKGQSNEPSGNYQQRSGGGFRSGTPDAFAAVAARREGRGSAGHG